MKKQSSKRSVLLAFLVIIILAVLALWGFRRLNRDYIRWSDYRVYTVSGMPVKSQDFKDDFEEIYQKVIHRYAYIDEKQLNMDSIHKAFTVRLDTIHQKADYALLLREFFANLKAGHADIRFRPYHIGNDAIVIENRVFISHPSEAALKAGLKDKDEIVAINHVPAWEWVLANEKYISASSDENRHRTSALESTYDYTDSIRIFNIRRGNEELVLTVNLLSSGQRSGKDWQMLTHRQLIPEVGYIAINMMNEAEIVSSFVDALNEYRTLPYLIIDVRENGGGNSQYGDKIAGYLIKHNCLNWRGNALTVNTNNYPGQVYVLMGPNSFSAAETFLVELKESGDVMLVGEPSAGDMGGMVLPYKTKYGTCFRLPVANRMTSPGGHPSEGTPIQPDYLVHQTVADFLADKDSAIEYVLHLLNIQK